MVTDWQPRISSPKKHGVQRVALLERGHIGQGNSGRNTQVTRSNYFYPVSSSFFDHSLKLYEGLGSELNFNVMLRQGGQINLAHSQHELEIIRRWANAIRMNGVDAEILSEGEIRKLVPILNPRPRFPILGGLSTPGGHFPTRRRGVGVCPGRERPRR